MLCESKLPLATLQGAQRDRTVQRYWDLAKENDVAFEVASLREILTDRDLGKLSEICPSNLDFDLESEAFPAEETIEVLPTDTIASKCPVAVREAGQKGLWSHCITEVLVTLLERWEDQSRRFPGDV